MAQQKYKTPIALAQNIQYEKPIINSDFYKTAYKDGYKLVGKESRLGKGRLDDLIDYYGLWNPDFDYAKAYLAYINPRDFLDLTWNPEFDGSVGPELREILNKKELDLDLVNSHPHTPFLELDFDNNEVVGHEGRHRMAAFASAGIDKVPVVIRGKGESFDKKNTKPYVYKNNVKGQGFDFTQAPGKQNLELDLTPLNYKNAPTLWEKFGYNK